MNAPSDLYLMHHGIKGMHWGIRRFEDENGHLTPAGKRRYAVQDARKYYKINRLKRHREKTDNKTAKKLLDGEIRRTQTRSDRKQALLSRKEINTGREIVAKHRLNWAGFNTAAKAAATAAGAYALYKNPETRALAPLAIAGGAALTYGSAKKVPYYFMENRRYKQGNEKGSTKLGLTKKQQTLRKAGKIAAGAALAGVVGYSLYKSGAAENIIRSGKTAIAGNNVSEATRAILNANQQASKKRQKQEDRRATINATGKAIKSVLGNSGKAKTAVGKAKGVVSTVKSKAKSKVRDSIFGDYDVDDPRTWLSPIKNTKEALSNTVRYARAANKLRKGDKVGAAAEVSDELVDAANTVIDKGSKQVRKFRRKRKE